MALVYIRCDWCHKEFSRSVGRFNEAVKNNWQQFCSPQCLSQSRFKGQKLVCDNPSCNHIFFKSRKEINKTTRSFCSQSCSAIVHNLERGLKNQKQCANSDCDQLVLSYKKFCSNQCFQESRNRQFKIIYKKRVLESIKQFVKQHNRIPFKREMNIIYRPARIAFGTWNQAVKAAGFQPNKLKFTRKHIANDGHVCDSLAEKIIDDWLFSHGINHQVNYPYPPDNRFTVDFKVNHYWIEFFGLSGQHQRYDELKQEKLELVKQKKLNLIEIYPHHLFPQSKLNQVLACLLQSF